MIELTVHRQKNYSADQRWIYCTLSKCYRINVLTLSKLSTYYQAFAKEQSY